MLWSELVSRPASSIPLLLIGAAALLCLWAVLSRRRQPRPAHRDETPRPAVKITPPVPVAQRRAQQTFVPPPDARPFPSLPAVTPPRPSLEPTPAAIVPLRAAEAAVRAVNGDSNSDKKEAGKPQPVPCALAVAATLAAVEAKRAATRTTDRLPH